jgi:hypothetical protein
MAIHIAGKKHTHNSSIGFAEKSSFCQVESSPYMCVYRIFQWCIHVFAINCFQHMRNSWDIPGAGSTASGVEKWWVGEGSEVLQKSKAIGRSVESGVLPCSEDVPFGGVTNSPPRYAVLPNAGPSVLGVFLGDAMDPVVRGGFHCCFRGSRVGGRGQLNCGGAGGRWATWGLPAVLEWPPPVGGGSMVLLLLSPRIGW